MRHERRFATGSTGPGSDLDAAVIAADGDRVIVELQWLDHALHEVVTFHGAGIIDIQDCPNREVMPPSSSHDAAETAGAGNSP